MPRVFCAYLLLIVAAGSLPAVSIYQVDTFQDGTTLGWFVPGASPNPPVNVATGGPAGAGDAYLRLAATGGATAGGRLAVLNESQWAGNYLAAGIAAIRMNANNFGPEDLYLRLLFEDFGPLPGPPVNLALSANAVVVPANSGWMTVQFPIAPGDLMPETFGTVVGALTDTNTLRIFHNPMPAFPGPGVGIPSVSAVLGVDNIAAIPEPGTWALLAGGFLLLLSRRR
jgi:hypothetical protein